MAVREWKAYGEFLRVLRPGGQLTILEFSTPVLPGLRAFYNWYSLRVLPKYGEFGASWDAQTFELNNSEANAYALLPGREQALTSTIEQRDNIYATTVNRTDCACRAAKPSSSTINNASRSA